MKIINTNLNNLISKIISKIISRISIDGISEEAVQNIVIAVIVAIFVIGAARALLRLGKRVLVVALLVVFTMFLGPKINLFLMNHLNRYNIVEKMLSQIVRGDIEEKVNREYRMKTGIDLRTEDPLLLEELMAEEYAVNPEDSDVVNIIKHAGFPEVVLKTILINIDNSQHAQIKADNFYDYAARFVTLRLVTFLSYAIAFFMADDLLNNYPGKNNVMYRYE